MGVRDLGRYPEFLCGYKRPVEISEISVNIRGLKCKPKSYVSRDENTRTWLSRRLRVE